MRCGMFFIVVTVVIGFLTPSFGQDAKKDVKVDDLLGGKKADEKKDKNKDEKKPQPKPAVEKFSYGFTFQGKLTDMGGVTGNYTIQVKNKVKVPHADAAKRLYNWQRRIAQLQRSIVRERNPIRRRQRIIELQKAKANPPELYHFKEVTQDYVIPVGKDMKVRTAFPEPQYDEKGNLIKFTPKTLKQLQGPEGYPGFPSQPSALHKGQYVQVYITNPKGVSTPNKKTPDISDIIGNVGEGKTPAELNPNLPRIVAIMILGESK